MVQRRLYNFRIDPDLDAGLKLVKERDHIPESEQIRLALREWLERRKVIKAERPRAVTRKRS
jgi:Arc/MetJ-type ribon-helix-helix transcriptional regulator